MILIFVAIGLGAGVLAGLFGIGGGIVIVPLLLIGTSMSILTATGTSLGALLLPAGALGAWGSPRRPDRSARRGARRGPDLTASLADAPRRWCAALCLCRHGGDGAARTTRTREPAQPRRRRKDAAAGQAHRHPPAHLAAP